MKRTLLVIGVVLATLVAGQGQASAEDFLRPFEDEMAEPAYAVEGGICSEWWLPPPYGAMAAKGCFWKHGDIWRIQDSRPDFYGTYVYWENWLWDGSRWRPYRHGQCNNALGAANWGICDKDYYESSSTNHFGSKGSRIRFQTCRRVELQDGCTPGSIEEAAWINNNG